MRISLALREPFTQARNVHQMKHAFVLPFNTKAKTQVLWAGVLRDCKHLTL